MRIPNVRVMRVSSMEQEENFREVQVDIREKDKT
jgi:hypothetical protein